MCPIEPYQVPEYVFAFCLSILSFRSVRIVSDEGFQTTPRPHPLCGLSARIRKRPSLICCLRYRETFDVPSRVPIPLLTHSAAIRLGMKTQSKSGS